MMLLAQAMKDIVGAALRRQRLPLGLVEYQVVDLIQWVIQYRIRHGCRIEYDRYFSVRGRFDD